MTTTPSYEFQASYCYAADERYNTGRGLSLITSDLEHANGVFDVYVNRRETYALEIRRMDTDEIIRSAGPSIDEAHRSMAAAIRSRKTSPGGARDESAQH